MKSIWAVGIVTAIIGFTGISGYNSLVTQDEKVGQSYAQVQNVMQRQAELIPNLVETVKGYAAHESGTLKAVSEARSQLQAVSKMSPEELAKNPDLQKKLVEAQAAMGRSLMQLNATREAYPNLKADAQFNQLMAELSGSVNRIAQERRRNQITVMDYNRMVRVFPRSLLAKIGGFEPKPYFQASQEAQTAPKVKF
jgi:LemA protein